MTLEFPWDSATDDHASPDANTTITSIIWIGTNSTGWNSSQPAIYRNLSSTGAIMVNTSEPPGSAGGEFN